MKFVHYTKKALAKEEGFKTRRRVVERTHGWLNRFRRILVRWEKLPENCLALLRLTCAIIVWRSVWWDRLLVLFDETTLYGADS